MISVEKALQIILENTPVLEAISVPIINSRKMVLAEDLVANDDIPPFDMAMTEGFAVQSDDIARASQNAPVGLKLDGEVRVGSPWPEPLQPGHAVKTASGAAVPQGSDTVIPAEFAVRDSTHRVRVYKSEKPGENIYPKGGDIVSGSTVLAKGKILTAADIGLLAALGRSDVLCHRRPRISFFASGNDLNHPDQPLQCGKIRAGNTYVLQSQLEEYGAEPVNLGIVGLDSCEIRASIEKALESDMFITSVGSSLDDFECMKGILQKTGMDLKFWKVAIRPGKPMIFGTFNSTPVFGMPGNHLSSMVILEEFIRPAICKMQGKREFRRTEVYARLDKDIRGGGGMTHYIRAEIRITDDGFLAIPCGNRTSPSVMALSLANGFIVMPQEANQISAGEVVRVQIITDPAYHC
jgi:molybdopterin molybdotransferase